ncbi:MAG: 30S ribosomal protein S9 [Nanoarchaeota archaeon]|nr:30S ribosomal protein S9 [Nanoarchaeota archaeon]
MNLIHVSGKRKKAVARATLKPGNGTVRVNKKLLDIIMPPLARLKMREPLILAGSAADKVNISVNVHGGGSMSQAEAARLAIAKALAMHDKKLRPVFLEYDRNMLVADVRRKEPKKPNSHGKARSKTQKSYR